MIFNDWIEGSSLFNEIHTIEPFPFIDLYGATNLDMLYKMTYGNRNIPESFKNLTVADVANVIVISYGQNWKNKYTLYTDEILLGVDSKTVTSELSLDDLIKEINSDNTNRVSAFNDDELSTKDSSDDNMSENSERETSRNLETTRTSLNAIKSQLESFNSNFIIDVVCKDVSKTVSLSIY